MKNKRLKLYESIESLDEVTFMFHKLNAVITLWPDNIVVRNRRKVMRYFYNITFWNKQRGMGGKCLMNEITIGKALQLITEAIEHNKYIDSAETDTGY